MAGNRQPQTKDKHDLLIAKYGSRVAVIEMAEVDGRVQAMGGETTLDLFKAMIRNLPNGHNLGLVQIITAGNLSGCRIRRIHTKEVND